MNSDTRKLLEAVQQGTMSVDEALLAIKKEPFADIGYAKVDMHRGIRQGAAEVIYGAGKTPAQMIGIIGVMRRRGQRTILITRLSPESAAEIAAAYPLDYHDDARCGIIGDLPEPDGIGRHDVSKGARQRRIRLPARGRLERHPSQAEHLKRQVHKRRPGQRAVHPQCVCHRWKRRMGEMGRF